MASLNTIIGSILRDIIAAQHAANKYTLSLSTHYGSSGKMKNFQLPNALISSLSLNIPYAIKSISSKVPDKKINYPKLHRKYEESAVLFAEAIVLGFMKTLKESNEVGQSQKFLDVYSGIMLDKNTKKKFCEFLTGKIINLLKDKTDSILNKEIGILHEAMILDHLETLATNEISTHNELVEHFQENSWETFLKQTLSIIRKNLACYTQRLCRSNFFIKEEDTVIDIISTTEEMKEMTSESIHSLSLTISPRQYSYIKGVSEEDEFILNTDIPHTP